MMTIAAVQHATIVGELARARSAADAAVATLAAARETTNWVQLAPPLDDLTLTFVKARPECHALVSIRALQSDESACCERGTAFPFEFDGKMSNGLATIRSFVCGKQSAVAVATGLATATDCVEFTITGTRAWHLMTACAALDHWPCRPAAMYSASRHVAAHAELSGDPLFAKHAQLLSRACFVSSLSNAHATPSESMRRFVHAQCTTELGDEERTRFVHQFAPEVRATIESDVVAMFPALIDRQIARTTALAKFTGDDPRCKKKVRSLCELFGADEGLRFDVGTAD